jgi:putative transcriptional regulator
VKLNTLLFAVLAAAATAVDAQDASGSMILVAKPALHDAVYGSAVLVVAPIGGDQHAGFIINRPTNTRLGQIFPDDVPSQKVGDPLYFGGPFGAQVIFALVERSASPGGKSFEVMAGLYAVLDAETVDRIIGTESDRARFVQGLVVWQAGELEAEIDRGCWYVLAPDADLALQRPAQGLWEDLVRASVLREDGI